MWRKWDVEKTAGVLKLRCRYLFQFGQSQGVVVLDFELHEAHVCRMRELRDDTESREQPGGKITQRKKEFVREIAVAYHPLSIKTKIVSGNHGIVAILI